MSGVLRSIGKAFKTVVNVVKKVAPIALAVGAVVMTGGAALGLTPTFAAGIGSLVGGLGLSAPLAGALTGSIVSAGFGSAAGGVMAGATGGNIMSGMQKGALTGAITGGALGAVSPGTFGMAGAKTATGGLMQSASTAAPSAGTGGLSSMGAQASGAFDATFGAAPAAAGAAGAAAPAITTAASAAAAPATGGLMSFVNKNPMLAGNVISGLAKGLGGGDGRSYEDQTRAGMDMANFAYKGAYAGRRDPFGVAAPLAVPSITPAYGATKPRWRYDAQTNTVVEDAA